MIGQRPLTVLHRAVGALSHAWWSWRVTVEQRKCEQLGARWVRLTNAGRSNEAARVSAQSRDAFFDLVIAMRRRDER